MNLISTVKTNGSVTLLAFCCLIAISISLSSHAKESGGKDKPQHQRPQFSSLDLDSDGSVSFAEFEQSKIPNDDHATIFGHIDADGDGVITEQEFNSHKPPGRKR
jgi:Ca2+-binding EF-hand superfamily protein